MLPAAVKEDARGSPTPLRPTPPPAYTTKKSVRKLAYAPNARKLSRRSLASRSSSSSSRRLSRKESEVSVVSVEARRSQLEIMAAATGMEEVTVSGAASSKQLNEEALEAMRRSYVRKLSLEILASSTRDTRTELHCDILLELLKDDPFFRELSESVRRELCRVMGYKNLAPDKAVFRRGDPGDNFYIILTGSVAVYADKVEGMPLAELREGKGFGEVALANDLPRTASIITRDQTELLYIAKRDYRSILRELQFKEYSEKTACFKSLPHFRHWDKYALVGLSKACKLVTETANKVMCRQGDIVTHIFIIKKGRCRLIKEIPAPRVKCCVGESTTADRLLGRHDCFVEAEALEEGSFFGENGVLALGKDSQPVPGGASAGPLEQPAAPASAGTDLDDARDSPRASRPQESEVQEHEDVGGEEGSEVDGTKNPASRPTSTGGPAKRPRRPSQILKSTIPEVYPASLVTGCETQFLVIRLVDFLRCCNTTDTTELLQFASYRVHTLSPETVRRRLTNQIQWERKKRDVLLAAKIPKYSRALQLHRPPHEQHIPSDLHAKPFRR